MCINIRDSNKKEKHMKKYNYEKDFNRLEQIVEELENDQTSLEDSLKLFNEAVALYANCKQTLVNAQLEVNTLVDNLNEE